MGHLVEVNLASDKQRKANARNAAKSTGPRSASGKATSSRNAITNGFFSRETVVIPNESFLEYERFRRSVVSDLAPVGAVEELLADSIVGTQWKIRRLLRVETADFTSVIPALPDRYSFTNIKAVFARSVANIADDELAKAEVPLPMEQSVGEVAAHMDAGLLAYARKAEAFTKLPRYEMHLWNLYYKALHELQRLQAARIGRALSVPVALDVTIDGRGHEADA